MQALTASKAESWLENAVPGSRITYHQGNLAIDRSHKSSAALVLNKVATLFLHAAYVPRGVHLFQDRMANSRWAYVAIKR